MEEYSLWQKLLFLKMIWQEIKNKENWENFLSDCQEKTFLQSWNWGELQKKMGNKIWRLKKGEEIMALVVGVKAKRGGFLLIQHLTQHPKLKTQNYRSKFKTLETLFNELKEIAKKEHCSFIRVIPLWERNEENIKLFKDLGFREAPIHASAYEATWKLSLTLPEENLLMNMRKTTRYLIRQAQKSPDLTIIKSNKIETTEIHNRLTQKVARHQKFIPFSFQFIRNEFEIFAKDNQALLFLGKFREKIIASALVIFWSNIGFYHQAALDPQYHKLPIAYLLQWEAIKEAKRRDCYLYDFWGFVDPQKQPKHPWAGPTQFKVGFGGKPYFYLKTQDFPLSKKYWLIYLFERLRKIKRGL